MPTPKYGEFGELMWKNSPNQCPDAVSGMGVCQKIHPLFCFSFSVIFAIYCQAAIFPSHMINCSVFCLRQVKTSLFMR
jgi:hypothetical protein